MRFAHVVFGMPFAFGLQAFNAQAEPQPQIKAPREPSADEIGRRVQRFYDKARSFEARFVQRFDVRAYHRRKKSRGRVLFEKSFKMSWRYAGSSNRVVSDGKTVKIYEARSKRFMQQPLSRSPYRLALAFLGGGNLRAEFRLKSLDADRMGARNSYVLDGVPTRETSLFTHVVIYVDAGTYQVRRVVLVDAQGNHNRFDFASARVNERIPPGEFRFEPPAGSVRVQP